MKIIQVVNSLDCGGQEKMIISLASVSRATAFREILDMLEKKLLCPLPGKGRSARYDILWPKS